MFTKQNNKSRGDIISFTAGQNIVNTMITRPQAHPATTPLHLRYNRRQKCPLFHNPMPPLSIHPLLSPVPPHLPAGVSVRRPPNLHTFTRKFNHLDGRFQFLKIPPGFQLPVTLAGGIVTIITDHNRHHPHTPTATADGPPPPS